MISHDIKEFRTTTKTIIRLPVEIHYGAGDAVLISRLSLHKEKWNILSVWLLGFFCFAKKKWNSKHFRQKGWQKLLELTQYKVTHRSFDKIFHWKISLWSGQYFIWSRTDEDWGLKWSSNAKWPLHCWSREHGLKCSKWAEALSNICSNRLLSASVMDCASSEVTPDQAEESICEFVWWFI